jgi:hypothetical protein
VLTAVLRAFNAIQKIGAKVVIKSFRIVAREVIETEISLYSIKERYIVKTVRT